MSIKESFKGVHFVLMGALSYMWAAMCLAGEGLTPIRDLFWDDKSMKDKKE